MKNKSKKLKKSLKLGQILDKNFKDISTFQGLDQCNNLPEMLLQDSIFLELEERTFLNEKYN